MGGEKEPKTAFLGSKLSKIEVLGGKHDGKSQFQHQNLTKIKLRNH